MIEDILTLIDSYTPLSQETDYSQGFADALKLVRYYIVNKYCTNETYKDNE